MAEAATFSARARSRAEKLLGEMTLAQKIGQMVQIEGADGQVPLALRQQVASGAIGSVINEVDPAAIAELQRIAREESPNGIPLLIGRDVIHGFKTVFPIPLGMAASWNPELVEEAARVSAAEAAEQGVNWTFSPMLDVSRDPRWGRIAESFGEDPLLTAEFGTAMVRGYQNGGDRQLISCLKHFVGYGACEAGKDYASTNIPDTELHNVYLPPFLAGVRAGAQSLMPSFSDLNGSPPSGNRWLLRDILRERWGFEGFVISDWASIAQLVVHGVAADDEDAARQSVVAGVNMDMVSGAYAGHLELLVKADVVPVPVVDELVCELLTAKYAAGLFDQAKRRYSFCTPTAEAEDAALRAAQESIVLLKNSDGLLPLAEGASSLCLLGPLADQPDEQLGTWVFDGDVSRSVSLKQALERTEGNQLQYDAVLATSRDRSHSSFAQACQRAEASDVTVLTLGEEAILSGEAHCRADISLPGSQLALAQSLKATGKPLIVVVMAGRPLAIPELAELADALLYVWHPGSMAGPAIADVLFGRVEATGRLPVTLPRSVGQVPIYYAHGKTGKPATPETIVHIDDIDAKAPQTSVGNTSFHLDVDPSPLYPFGFGLSYTKFEFSDFQEVRATPLGGVELSALVRNIGDRPGREVVQLYVRDKVASVTRPVRELKAWQLVTLEAGASEQIRFRLSRDDLSFYNGRETVFEPGGFTAWVGNSSDADLSIELDVR